MHFPFRFCHSLYQMHFFPLQILSCNPLDHLPVKMSAMTQLRLLDIDGCPMVTLPEQFRNLPSVSALPLVRVYMVRFFSFRFQKKARSRVPHAFDILFLKNIKHH